MMEIIRTVNKLNPAEHLWEILETVSSITIIKIEGISFERIVFITTVQLQRLVESIPMCAEAVLTSYKYILYWFLLMKSCIKLITSLKIAVIGFLFVCFGFLFFY